MSFGRCHGAAGSVAADERRRGTNAPFRHPDELDRTISPLVWDRVKITSNLILRLLEQDGLDPAAERAEIVIAARRPAAKILPTLLSAWRAEGQPLNPALDYELHVHRARAAAYARLHDELVSVAPLVRTKGARIAARYPAQITRQYNDLDYVTNGRDALWAATQYLVARGWATEAITIAKVDSKLAVLIRMSGESPDEFLLSRDAVEIS
jgi:hypothetical protein